MNKLLKHFFLNCFIVFLKRKGNTNDPSLEGRQQRTQLQSRFNSACYNHCNTMSSWLFWLWPCIMLVPSWLAIMHPPSYQFWHLSVVVKEWPHLVFVFGIALPLLLIGMIFGELTLALATVFELEGIAVLMPLLAATNEALRLKSNSKSSTRTFHFP